MVKRKGDYHGSIHKSDLPDISKVLEADHERIRREHDKDAPKDIKSVIIRADNLIKTLKNFTSDVKSSKKEIQDMGIKAMSRNIDGRNDYTSKLEEYRKEFESELSKKLQNPQKDQNQVCPKCGAPLVIRTVKKGEKAGTLAYGCSRFSKCWYMRDLTEEEKQKHDIKPANETPEPPKEKNLICPKCGLPLVVRNIKKGDRAGKQAYGCSGYPKCYYMINID